MTDSASTSTDSELKPDLPGLLTAARDHVRRMHRRVPGTEIAARYSEDMDGIIVRHCEWVMSSNPDFGRVRDQMVIVAIGGYGRREMNLHSDVDLMLLFRKEPDDNAQEFIKAFTYPLWDLKIDLGYMVKTFAQVIEEAGEDIDTTTAVIGANVIWGNEKLSNELLENLRIVIAVRHSRELTEHLLRATRGRHQKYANTRLLLEPSIKEAPGGLRDLHVMEWLAFIRYGEADLSCLTRHGILTPREEADLRRQHDFLLEVRNSMHLLENRKVDVLNFERQIKIADDLGFKEQETGLPEEQFMRAYYEHVGIVDRLLGRVVNRIEKDIADSETSGSSSSRRRLRSRRFEGLYWTRGNEIWVDPKDASILARDPSWMMHLFALSALYGLDPDDFTLDLVEENRHEIDDEYRASPQHRERFLMILRQPLTSAKALRYMHRSRFLECYLPEFARVRNLPRIDYYHQFTVDEHLLRATQCTNDLFDHENPFGRTHVAGVAREILRRDLLVFATLVHDLGKGEGRGHVIRGAHMIQRIADRMGFTAREKDILHLLVAKHQKMSHIALKRNTEDPGVPMDLARDVGNPEMLRMLYVLTCCDMRAVSDESWNDWRATLLRTLYERTLNVLVGQSDIQRRSWASMEEVPRLVIEEVKAQRSESPCDDEELERSREVDEERLFRTENVSTFVTEMPARYRHATPPQQIARHMCMVDRLGEDEMLVMELEQTGDSNYAILHCAVRDSPGLFCNLCGALMSRGINILSAQVYTARNGICIDVFQVQDNNNKPPTDEAMFERLRKKLVSVLRGQSQTDWKEQMPRMQQAISAARLDLRPPSVSISNDESADGYTILEVKAPDRPGLLYDITSVLDKYRIHIHIAIVATESYQVVDVFYVTDWENDRLEPGKTTNALRDDLLEAIAPPAPVNTPAEDKG